MPNWGRTYTLRQEQTAKEVSDLLVVVNSKLLNLPEGYRITVDRNGRKIELTKPQGG